MGLEREGEKEGEGVEEGQQVTLLMCAAYYVYLYVYRKKLRFSPTGAVFLSSSQQWQG